MWPDEVTLHVLSFLSSRCLSSVVSVCRELSPLVQEEARRRIARQHEGPLEAQNETWVFLLGKQRWRTFDFTGLDLVFRNQRMSQCVGHALCKFEGMELRTRLLTVLSWRHCDWVRCRSCGLLPLTHFVTPELRAPSYGGDARPACITCLHARCARLKRTPPKAEMLDVLRDYLEPEKTALLTEARDNELARSYMTACRKRMPSLSADLARRLREAGALLE